MRGSRRRTLAITAGLLVALAATSCGDGNDEEATGSEPAPTSSSAAATDGGGSVGESQAIVDEALSLDKTYPEPPGAFDPGQKKAAVIAQGFVIPVLPVMAEEAVQAYEAMGWEVLPAFDGELNPATYGAQLDQVTQQQVDAVTFISTPLGPIKASVQRARDAGIAITCAMCDIPADIKDLGVADGSVDFVEQGKILAASIIARSGGKAKVVITAEPSQQTVTSRVKGAEDQFATCEQCEVETITIPAATSVQPGPPIWTATLTKNPAGSGLTDAIAYYDGLALTMATTLDQQGRTDVAVSGFDADPTAVTAIGKGPIAATLAAPYPYLVWSAVDLAARISADAELWDASKAPSLLILESNAADYEPYIGPEGDWRAMFKTNWGTS